MEKKNGKTKYPIVLVHGIMLKDFKFFKAFGRIEKILKKEGYSVYTAKTDGFGTIENNAVQLKEHVQKIIAECGCEKVNLIAHSKGGLDCRHMLERLDGKELTASLTTLCTPHRGSPVASLILRAPRWMLKFTAFWFNLGYRIFGDKHPDALKVCEELQTNEGADDNLSSEIYCQSFSSTLEKSRDDFIMGIPLIFSRKLESASSDGLVSAESAKFGEYRGNCIDGSFSHTEVIDFMANKKKRERIYAFYTQLCERLAEAGL